MAFKVGTLVWAKMKGFPAWPGKVIEPKDGKTPDKRPKNKHHVFFYGSENYAWIPVDQIWLYATNPDKFVLNQRAPKGFKEALESIKNAFESLPADERYPSDDNEKVTKPKKEPKKAIVGSSDIKSNSTPASLETPGTTYSLNIRNATMVKRPRKNISSVDETNNEASPSAPKKLIKSISEPLNTAVLSGSEKPKSKQQKEAISDVEGTSHTASSHAPGKPKVKRHKKDVLDFNETTRDATSKAKAKRRKKDNLVVDGTTKKAGSTKSKNHKVKQQNDNDVRGSLAGTLSASKKASAKKQKNIISSIDEANSDATSSVMEKPKAKRQKKDSSDVHTEASSAPMKPKSKKQKNSISSIEGANSNSISSVMEKPKAKRQRKAKGYSYIGGPSNNTTSSALDNSNAERDNKAISGEATVHVKPDFTQIKNADPVVQWDRLATPIIGKTYSRQFQKSPDPRITGEVKAQGKFKPSAVDGEEVTESVSAGGPKAASKTNQAGHVTEVEDPQSNIPLIQLTPAVNRQKPNNVIGQGTRSDTRSKARGKRLIPDLDTKRMQKLSSIAEEDSTTAADVPDEITDKQNATNKTNKRPKIHRRKMINPVKNCGRSPSGEAIILDDESALVADQAKPLEDEIINEPVVQESVNNATGEHVVKDVDTNTEGDSTLPLFIDVASNIDEKEKSVACQTENKENEPEITTPVETTPSGLSSEQGRIRSSESTESVTRTTDYFIYLDVDLEKEAQMIEQNVVSSSDKIFKKKTPKSAAKPMKRGRPLSPATSGVPLSKKSRILGKSPVTSTKRHSESPMTARVISVRPTVNHEKASSTVTATASSTSNTTPKKPLIDGYDGWSSSVTSFRKDSPMFERNYDRILEPSMVEPILSKSIIPTPLKIGFLGLGIMGSGMVSNLLRSGHEVTVWNRTPSKCREFVKDGALKGNSPAEVVQQCDITLSCVADPTALKDLVFGNCGVLQGVSQGKAYIDMSTVDVETISDVHEAVTARGGRFLEAPVIGSKQPALNGSLVILAAGDKSLYEDCYSCFEAMGKKSFYLGEIGSAARMKLVLNLFMGTLIAGLAESLALAEKVGLDQEEVLQILDISPAACPLVKSKGHAMIMSNYSDPHCKLQSYQKDLRLSVNMSDTVDQPLHVGSSVNELFKKAKAKGYGEHDTAAVYRAADL